MKHAAICLAMFGLTINPANALECTQEKAIYQNGNGFELRFIAGEYATTPYLLNLTNLTSGETYAGQIVYGNGFSVPHTSIGSGCKINEYNTYDCKLDIYEDLIYQINNNHAEMGVPGMGTPAVKAVLFPGLQYQFYMAFRSSPDTDLPLDAFKISACSE
ncbi:MAG: hypothetical protein JKY49_12555 [Cohaesibacteraceae bacterium]|nr:hypothetical protein [Cohaesibacteraceae bacterium]